jgi:two-component system invasion response regulator UvrY
LHGALTPREMQVMLKIAQGVSLTEIGNQLHLSVKTVGTHRSRVLEKLGLASNAELVQYAMRHRLVD